MPHAPQFIGSVVVSTQAVPHIIRGAAQVVTAMHAPAVQICPVGQTLPQRPQLRGSMFRMVHPTEPVPVGQQVLPAAHAQVHAPALQMRPVRQVVPHAPQLRGSLRVSTHAPPQRVWPVGQIARHVPVVHDWPVGHALPQRPQLRGSLRVSVQVALQRVWPPEQMGAQVPAVQSSPTAQALLQRPQWVFEVARSMHDVPHIIRGAAHIEMGVHTPAAQFSLAPHEVPHAPQLRASLWMSTQTVPQSRWKPVHTGTHAPAVHVSVAVHARPHDPQFCSSVWVSTHASRQML